MLDFSMLPSFLNCTLQKRPKIMLAQPLKAYKQIRKRAKGYLRGSPGYESKVKQVKII